MKIKKILAIVCVALAGCSIFSGCTAFDKEVYFESSCGRNTIFKIGDLKCPKKEALTYLVNSKNIYGTVDGVNLWTKDFDTDVICGSLKDAVIEHLTKVYVLNLYASENEIVLSETEEESCKKAASEYYSSLNDSEKSYMGVREKDICRMYEKYVLATKVYKELMDSVDEEVSEDECRVMEAFVLFVSSEDEAKEIQAKIDNGSTFERLAATYTELDSYKATFGRNQYDPAVDEVVFNLDTDEVSGAISADDGYYFFQCLNKYNEKLSEENKQVIIEKRRQQVINDIVEDLENRYYSDMNTKLWDKISIDSKMSDDLCTSTFFEILSKYSK